MKNFPENDHLARLSSSLNALPWGLVTVEISDEGPRVVFCNERADRLLKLPHGDVIGAPAETIFSAFGLGDSCAAFLLEKKIAYYELEQKENGRICWYKFHFIPYTHHLPHCLIVVEDTTSQKLREGHYIQAQRLEALGELAGGVAHDFNNILSIIDGYARMSQKAAQGNGALLDYLGKIRQSVQRGAGLTGRLLSFGRHRDTKKSVIDLGLVVREQKPLLMPLMDASIEMLMETEEEIFVDASVDDICQILVNLCVNARDAIVGNGKITITCTKDPKNCGRLCVADSGKGIAPDIRSRIFDPFFTTKEKGKGTGLGLSLVYELVTAMGGRIDVESAIGKGTTIIILFPLSKIIPHSHEIQEDAERNVNLAGFTALIAEDEPALLDLVSSMMEDMGVRVLKAHNGSEALMMQEDFEGDIDFLLTDVVMPEINGVKLAELFSSLRPNSKIMFMSGYPEGGQMARVELPADVFFIPKPVDFRTLGATIRDAVQDNFHTSLLGAGTLDGS